MIVVLLLIAATAGAILLALDRARQLGGLCWTPCCSPCEGVGRCWDCRGTGHPHDPKQRYPK